MYTYIHTNKYRFKVVGEAEVYTYILHTYIQKRNYSLLLEEYLAVILGRGLQPRGTQVCFLLGALLSASVCMYVCMYVCTV